MIRYAFKPQVCDVESVRRNVALVSAAIFDRFEATEKAERPFFTWYRTKGKLLVTDETHALVRELEKVCREDAIGDPNFIRLSNEDVIAMKRGTFTTFLFLCGLSSIDDQLLNDIAQNDVGAVVGDELSAQIRAHYTSRLS